MFGKYQRHCDSEWRCKAQFAFKRKIKFALANRNEKERGGEGTYEAENRRNTMAQFCRSRCLELCPPRGKMNYSSTTPNHLLVKICCQMARSFRRTMGSVIRIWSQVRQHETFRGLWCSRYHALTVIRVRYSGTVTVSAEMMVMEQLISNGDMFKPVFTKRDKKQTMIDLRGISTNG